MPRVFLPALDFATPPRLPLVVIQVPGEVKSCREGQAGNTRWEIRRGMEPAGPKEQGRAAAGDFKGSSRLR